MSDKYDVIIVGMGPSSIFCAYELIQLKKYKKILLIDQGKRVEDRYCPIEKTKKCIHCKPMCNITNGFSGAGAFSDGKLSLYNKEDEERIKDLENMGTTIDICLVIANKVYIGHVGDSRVYRKRKDFFRKLTTDHSYVQKLVNDGTITKEEAYNHPKKNMLIKALGSPNLVNPDVMVKGFLKDDILLMCSDGLTNMLKDEEIVEVINEDPTKACNKLVDMANEQGGYDNITAVIIL